MIAEALFKSEKQDWETPADFFAELDREFGFNLDVCANLRNAKCENFIGPRTDADVEELSRLLAQTENDHQHETSRKIASLKEAAYQDYVESIGEDSLSEGWTGYVDGPAHCWMNPPYGAIIGRWIMKAEQEAAKGALVVCLLPSRTDTRYFHQHLWDDHLHRARPGVELRFVKSRLRFVGADSSAPFPSVVVVFHPWLQLPKVKRAQVQTRGGKL